MQRNVKTSDTQNAATYFGSQIDATVCAGQVAGTLTAVHLQQREHPKRYFSVFVHVACNIKRPSL